MATVTVTDMVMAMVDMVTMDTMARDLPMLKLPQLLSQVTDMVMDMAMDMVLVMDMAVDTDISDMDMAVMDTMDIMVSDLLRLRLSLVMDMDTVMDMDMVAMDTMDIMARGLLMLDMAMV